jgi:hypothetical protein
MMLNMRKRSYSEFKSTFGDIGDPCKEHQDQEVAELKPDVIKALPQRGPADLEFLLKLPATCLSKDVRAAVQKAAVDCNNTAASASTFLGVRRKQRCGSLSTSA